MVLLCIHYAYASLFQKRREQYLSPSFYHFSKEKKSGQSGRLGGGVIFRGRKQEGQKEITGKTYTTPEGGLGTPIEEFFCRRVYSSCHFHFVSCVLVVGLYFFLPQTQFDLNSFPVSRPCV